MKKPTFLMCFANDRTGTYLRGIASEQDGIRQALKDRIKLCKYVPIADLTHRKLIDAVQEYKPTVFHYGGHADGSGIIPEDGNRIGAGHLADTLTHFSDLDLVFLNGCASYEQAKSFRDSGVRHVIVTNKVIDDGDAVEFANRFYYALGGGSTVPDAFGWATKVLNVRLKKEGEVYRGIKIGEDPNKPIWQLISDPDREPWRWQIQALGRVKAEHKYGQGLPGVKVRKGKLLKCQTDDEGFFDIEIEQDNLDKEYLLELEKQNYRVVNERALQIRLDENGNLGKEIVEVIMCPVERYPQARRKYLEEIFNIRLNEEADSTGKITSEKAEQLAAQVGSVANQMTSIDLSTAEDKLKEALHLIEEFKFEEAADVLDSDYLTGHLETASELNQQARDKKKMAIDALLLKASAYMMSYDFDATEECYAQAVQVAPENYTIKQTYVDYLYKQTEYAAAEQLCRSSLTRIDKELQKVLARKAKWLHQHGRIRFKMNEIEPAMAYFQQASDILKSMAEQTRQFVTQLQSQLQIQLDQLVDILGQPNDFDRKAVQAAFSDLLELKTQIAEVDLAEIESQKAATLNNLGNLLMRQRRFKEAEKMLKESLQIDQELYAKGKEYIRPFLAINYNDLGELFAAKGHEQADKEKHKEAAKHFQAAAKNYEAALAHRTELAEQDPTKYRPGKAETLLNLGKLHAYQQNFDRALEYYQQAVTIQSSLANNNPTAHAPDLATSYHNFGKLYTLIGCQAETEGQPKQADAHFKQAEENFIKAKRIREELMEGNERSYKDEYAATLLNFGIFYRERADYVAAETCLLDAERLDTELVLVDEPTYQPYLAACHYELGLLYNKMKKPEQAKRWFDKVIQSCEDGGVIYGHHLAAAMQEREALS